MNSSLVIFETSGWWILIFVIVALAMGVLTYQKKNPPWSKTLNYVLMGIRSLGIFLVIFLVLNPLINQVDNTSEPPEIVFALDNSVSVAIESDSTQILESLSSLMSSARSEGYATSLITLDGIDVAEQANFDVQETDLNRMMLGIDEMFESRNLGAVVLFSDGIYNTGNSPRFRNSLYPVFTMGLGDTTAQKDVAIFQVNANKVVYQGNQFPIRVLINSNGFRGVTTDVVLRRNGQIIDRKEVELRDNLSLNFAQDAEEPGLARYEFEIAGLPGESTTTNNKYSFFIDVVEGKENILILARSPHPDIGAIRSSIDRSENYSTDVFIQGLTELDPSKEYDVVVVHHAFQRNFAIPEIKGDPSYWYLLGSRTNIGELPNRVNTEIVVKNVGRDNVRPSYNTRFSKFQLEQFEAFNFYPTIDVPYGDYQVLGPQEILLYQRVGNVVTDRPLLAIYDDGSQRFATLFGLGVWKWPLQETAFGDSREAFDQLVLRTIQYLSVRNDKRKFVFDPAKQTFREGESISFLTESYNDLYERIGGNAIELLIVGDSGRIQNFEFSANASNSVVFAGSMKEGIYQFTASTQIAGQSHQINGEFLVENLNLEFSNTKADHQLLKDLASRTGGNFYALSDAEEIKKALADLQLKDIIYSSRAYIPLINQLLVLAILTLMFTLEWATRKYMGSY